MVKVRHSKGVAIHTDPESCAGNCREAAREALTGGRTGEVLSGESNVVRGVDAVVACRRQQAQVRHREDLGRAEKILEELGVTLNREKTRIVHISKGFEFLGFKIQRGKNRFKLSRDKIKSRLNRQHLYAIPTQKSFDRFKDQIRALTKRQVPLRLGELIQSINPVIRGWGNYYCRSHVRKRFHQLDGWIIRRLWSHRAKRWRNAGWRTHPTRRLREEFELVSLVSLIPSLQIAKTHS